MTEVKKLKFSEITEAVKASKNNSDLENLAHAVEYIVAGRIALKKQYEKALAEMHETEAKIYTLADAIEKGDVQEYETVHDLYNKARKVSNISL